MKSEQTHFLSQEEREEGLKNYQLHTFWNGLGINFLNTTVISLLAITFGASNLQLGYISSVFHVAGLVLIFLPKLLNGKKIKTVFFLAWFVRGLLCFLYGALFFMEGKTAVSWILLLYTLFAVARVIGVPMVQPIQRSLVNRSEEGGLVLKLHFRLSISHVISQITSFVLTSIEFFSGLAGLVFLTFIGSINNTISSLFIRKVPSRERIEYRKGKNIFVLLAATLKHPVRGRIFVVRLINLAAGILLTFGVAFLRRAVELPANMVFIHTLIGAIAALVSTQILKPFVDSVGSRSLMVFSSLLLAVCSFGWAYLPTDLPWVIYFGFGFFIAFLTRLRLLLMSRLLIRTLPSRDRISYTAMLHFMSAVVGIAIGLTGGALADFSELRQLATPHIYTLTYLLAGVLCLVGGLISIRIKDPGALSLRETAAVFLSVKTIRAYLDIYQLDVTDSQKKRESSMLSLEQSDTTIATEQLRLRLKSPLPWEKERILRSLSSYPREELLDDIIREAQDPYSYNRRDAIYTLGSYSSRRTAKALREIVDDGNPEIAAAALRSLGRIGRTADIDRIFSILEDPRYVGRAEIDALRALSLMDTDGQYMRSIFSLVPKEKGRRFQQLAFILCARSLGLNPPLSDYFRLENQESMAGYRELINEAKLVPAFLREGSRLLDFYDKDNIPAIWSWCSHHLGDRIPDDALRYLRTAILEAKEEAYSRTNAFAVTYFTYQLLKPEGDES